MLYAALVMWLMVMVFAAQAVNRLWAGFGKPKIVNMLLLPGTVVAQLGYVLGCFASGSPVSGVVLMGSDQQGDAQAAPAAPRIPVVGSIIVALGPLVTCGLAIYLLANYLGGSVLNQLAGQGAYQAVPISINQFWDLLHSLIDMAAGFAAAFELGKLVAWRHGLLLYFTICLTVRMAPLPGNFRGSVLAIIGFGIILAIVGNFTGSARAVVLSVWPVLTYAAAGLICLMIISLLVCGAILLISVLLRRG